MIADANLTVQTWVPGIGRVDLVMSSGTTATVQIRSVDNSTAEAFARWVGSCSISAADAEEIDQQPAPDLAVVLPSPFDRPADCRPHRMPIAGTRPPPHRLARPPPGLVSFFLSRGLTNA